MPKKHQYIVSDSVKIIFYKRYSDNFNNIFYFLLNLDFVVFRYFYKSFLLLFVNDIIFKKGESMNKISLSVLTASLLCTNVLLADEIVAGGGAK